MRMIVLGIYLALFVIVSIPMYFIACFIGRKDERKKVAFTQAMVRVVFRMILGILGAKVECEGVEKVPKDEAVMYIANHRSYCDILAGYLTVPNLTSFVAKKGLGKVPCLSRWMRYLKCLFLDRENQKEGLKIILQGIEQIKEGYSVFIMPEGTRNSGEGLLPFHEGSFKLSTKTGCAIVPITMKNADKAIGHHFAWFSPTKIKVLYGDPVYPDRLEPEEKKHVGAYMRDKMQHMLEKME